MKKPYALDRVVLCAVTAIMFGAVFVVPLAHADMLVAHGDSLKYYKSTGTPPSPSWNTVGYDDSSWATGTTPIGLRCLGFNGGTCASGYDNDYVGGVTATHIPFGTRVDDMHYDYSRGYSGYKTLFSWQTFNISNLATFLSDFNVMQLMFSAGFEAWINGTLVASDCQSGGSPCWDNVNGTEPYPYDDGTSRYGYRSFDVTSAAVPVLATGTNVLAISNTVWSIRTIDSRILYPELAAFYDTTSPSIPANVSGTSVSPVEVDLSWDASTDPDGSVAGYRIYRDEVQIATSTVSGIISAQAGITAETIAFTFGGTRVQPRPSPA